MLVNFPQMNADIRAKDGSVVTEPTLERLHFGVCLLVLVHGVEGGEGLAAIFAAYLFPGTIFLVLELVAVMRSSFSVTAREGLCLLLLRQILGL